ncbi:hypothetical protein DL89DRAFT_82589 [Linderina pennispora]|uniref:Uncharacterized protein n=1 Tax=Linderina pennispora TaxID=61395 RepID=A0A1Y1WHP6_9FUNG|nr:uncharacterized protein DL89DRAFT_82589 [Linderina pennispora]ORX72756.1 hypothetical protein DL89DRAFT_82589 [Linderina pennispora]
MDVASRLRSLVFSLIRTPIAVTATLWTWAMAAPRALVHYMLRLIELFENTMLTIVWEYQGDNLLKFLYTHSHIPQAALKHSETRSQGVQTTDLDTHDLARNARQRRDVLMTQVLEDLVPALLQALHAMPQRGELDRMSQEQTQWAKIIASQQRQLMDAKMHDESLEAYTQIAATLQVLVSRIGSVDERLIRALNVSSGHVDQQLVSLQDGLGRVSRECELDKSAISELVVRLSQLDNVLMSIAASPRTLPGKTDAAVDTAGSDVADGEMEGTSKA